jgi:hypothetical protein
VPFFTNQDQLVFAVIALCMSAMFAGKKLKKKWRKADLRHYD